MAIKEEDLTKMRSFREDVNRPKEEPKTETPLIPQVAEPKLETKSLETASKDAVQEAKQKSRAKLVLLEGGLKGVERTKIPSISDMPTPGGISLLFMLTVFILFAFVHVKDGSGNDTGLTRLQYIWASIIGNAVFNSTSGTTSQSSPGGPIDNPSGVPGQGSIWSPGGVPIPGL